MSCGVGRRCGLDPTLLWLWRRLGATAPIRPVAWEPPHALGAAQEIAKRQKKKKKKKNKQKKTQKPVPLCPCIAYKLTLLLEA